MHINVRLTDIYARSGDAVISNKNNQARRICLSIVYNNLINTHRRRDIS